MRKHNLNLLLLTVLFGLLSILSAAPCGAACTPPPFGMVVWWPGDGDANDIVNGVNGVLVGNAAYAPGKVLQAFSFDGNGDYVEIADNPLLNPAGGFTVDGWFFIDPLAPGNDNGISALAAKSTMLPNDGGWLLMFDDRGGLDLTNGIRFAVFGGAAQLVSAAADNVILTVGWYHIAGVFDPATMPQAKLYIDGNLAADSGLILSIPAALGNALNMRIGAMNYIGPGNDNFEGLADEVEFFLRPLPQVIIQDIFNAGVDGKCKTFNRSDLAITKSGDLNPVTAGGALTYTINVVNNGPDTAQAVGLKDKLPAGVAFVSAIPTAGSCNEAAGIVTCDFGDMPALTSAAVNIVVTAPTVAGVITNIADTACAQIDPVLTNNTAALITNVILPVIVATAGLNGAITPPGINVVAYGLNQTFNILPDPCYQVADVLVDGVSVGPVTTFTFNNVTANHAIAASFALINYTINASAGVGGNITPAGGVPAGCGLNRAFNITPDPCYLIADVLVDGVSVGPVSVYIFNNVAANHTIAASFIIRTFTILANAGANGQISPAGGVNVNCGANQTFNILPDPGYQVADVLVDGVAQGAIGSYTFNNVIVNHAIDAVFILSTVNKGAIAGKVVKSYQKPFRGVTVNLVGPVSAVAVTNSLGNYVFKNLPPGNYTVTPSYTGCTFAPGFKTTTVTLGAVRRLDFADADALFIISGRVFDLNGGPFGNVRMVLLNVDETLLQTARTGLNGAYRFIVTGGAFIVAPAPLCANCPETEAPATGDIPVGVLTFCPPFKKVTVSNGNRIGVDFSQCKE